MASVQTFQGFVRALKAASDPPSPGSQYKIEIARQVWDDASFHVPNKAEVIVEWILSKLVKEKDKETALNPILDVRFWTLLYDVVSSSSGQAAETHARPLKTWLPALLNRFPFAPTLLSLFGLLRGLDTLPRKALSRVVSPCLAVIWPLAIQKLNTEAIVECFGSFMDTYISTTQPDENLACIGNVVTSSYRNCLWNSSNKKKVYTAFLHNYLPSWLACAAQSTTDEPHKSLLDAIYDAGAETLFNLDILRQTRDSKTEDALFESIAPVLSSNLEIYSVLPRIFSSYIESIKKHRGALVSQGSAQLPATANAEIQSYGMRFFASCLSMSDGREQTTQSWSTTVSLLSLIDQEALFNRKQVEAEVLLNRIIEQALANLETNTSNSGLGTYAVESLSALARIDYELIVPLVPRIFQKLLLSRDSSLSSLTFLDLILAYHTKTRTANTYIETLFSALLPHQTPSFQDSPREAYQTSLSGPLFEATHLQHLSKAIQAFLSGGQALPTTEFIYSFLKDAWENFEAAGVDGEERSPKRRKTMDVDSISPVVSRDHWAVVFALSTHIATVVLSSLPVHAVTEVIRQELLSLLRDVRKFAHRIVKKAMKVLKKLGGDDAWSLSIVAAASLRLQYALDISGYVSPPSFEDEKLCKKISEIIQSETLLPELLIELSRFLFHMALKREHTESQAAFDHALTYLERNFKTSKASWSGQAHHLTPEKMGRKESALALMHMIAERWLPVIESFATTEQLMRLVQVIMSINIGDSEETLSSGLQARTLLLQTLDSAQFWELPKIRVIVLEYIGKVISAPDEDGSNISGASISGVISAYRLLLIFPVEYFSRSSRAEFTRRALTLDRLILGRNKQPELKYEHLTVLRAFLGRVFSSTSSSDLSIRNICDALDHLMSSQALPSPHDENFTAATMHLIEALFLEMFRRLEKSSPDGVLSLLRTFAQINTEPLERTIRAHSIVPMIKVLESNFKVTSFSDEVQLSLRQLHQTLSTVTQPRMSMLAADASTAAAEHQSDLMILWCSLLSFGKWLVITDVNTPFVGKHLITKLISQRRSDTSPIWDRNCVTALAILLEEFHLSPESGRLSQLEFILAASVSLHRVLGPSDRQQVDRCLSRTYSNLSVSEFSYLVDLLSEALKSNSSPVERTHILRIAVVLLRDHPQGTLKQMQSFSTQTLHVFAGWHGLIDGPVELRLQTLEFIAQLCTEQPAVLRLGDMGGLWSLLSSFLAGSHDHDSDTTLDIFHKIINITSALIRLRRDLVTHTLPHLGSVLRQLLMSLRTVRPNLGVKQTLLVTDTQPRWLNAKHPLGVDEVKALARLLEALISKSMVRNNASSVDTQKAESLAKPFSKHAAYVLKAYITAMNDPLCLLPSEHRKELQRGLYALCSMMSDHSRDAMMVGALDAGGKSTMKTLWKEYEKQRYIGKARRAFVSYMYIVCSVMVDHMIGQLID
ncbi:Urb2/Npa2 family-domain-containing protein [Lyophyllum atratum]|nr:Urb2/Npa2 family-domain-containing protein [Lyophyllum atratum]